MESKNYAFSKKVNFKGNTEMRTMFGRNMALVFTKVNEYHYINLYNNNPRNPGRCSMGFDEYAELVGMVKILEELKSQFEEEIQKPANQLMPPPPPPPYHAQPIPVLGQANKRPCDRQSGGPPPKKQKTSVGEENFDPLDFFTQLQQFEQK